MASINESLYNQQVNLLLAMIDNSDRYLGAFSYSTIKI